MEFEHGRAYIYDATSGTFDELIFGRPVLQFWACNISLMQQSVLMGVVRGPDNLPKYHPVKPILRWYRRCLLLSAMDGQVITNPFDPRGGSFTGPSYEYTVMGSTKPHQVNWVPTMDHLWNQFMQSMDEMPIHFWLHLMHAIEIMAYKHSDKNIADWWAAKYLRMVHAMHVFPETEAQMDRRLGDDREGWLERSDEAITK